MKRGDRNGRRVGGGEGKGGWGKEEQGRREGRGGAGSKPTQTWISKAVTHKTATFCPTIPRHVQQKAQIFPT